MNFSWLSLIGGGFAAAATLTAGISMSGLFSPATPSGAQVTAAPVAETIYVEQPVIEVPSMVVAASPAELPPLVIAILPPDTATNTDVSTPTPSTGGGTSSTPSTGGGTAAPGSATAAPTLPPSFSDVEDGDDDGDSDEGEHEGGEYDD
jgi:hypothetical protein